MPGLAARTPQAGWDRPPSLAHRGCRAALGFVQFDQSLRDAIWLPRMFRCRGFWFAALWLWLAEAGEQLPPLLLSARGDKWL